MKKKRASEDEKAEWNTNFGKFWETLRDREAWYATVHGVTKSRI